MSTQDPTLDELDAFMVVMYPLTWGVASADSKQARRAMYRKAIAAAIAQARANDAAERKDHPEWKDGYRDGLAAGQTTVNAVAIDGGTAAEAVELLDGLLASAKRVLT